MSSSTSSRPMALCSVTDKTGLVDFVKQLVEFGYQIISTGGTAKHLRDAGIVLEDVAELTQFKKFWMAG